MARVVLEKSEHIARYGIRDFLLASLAQRGIVCRAHLELTTMEQMLELLDRDRLA